MARTTINPTQISITGSNASAISEGSLTATHVFLAQAASSTAVQTITADAMQKYFTKSDLAAAGDASHRVILTAVGDGADDVDLKFDAGILYDPTIDGTLTLTGDLAVGDDITLSSDSAVITLGASANSSTVTLTHVSASTPALRMQAAKKLSFGDEATFIQQSSDGVLQVQADGTVDINGGAIDIDGAAITVDATSGLSLQAAAASDFTVSSGDLSLIADAADAKVTIRSDVTGSATAIHLDGNAAAGAIVDIDAGVLDVDATGAVTIDAGGAIGLESSGGAISIGANDVNQNINIGTDGTRTITIGEAANSTVSIKSKGGSLGLEATGQTLDVNAQTFDVDATSISLSASSQAEIQLGSSLDIDAVGALSVDSVASISIGANSSGVAVTIGASSSETTVQDNLTVTGDLTVNGTTTTVNSTTLQVDDKVIVLGKDNSTTNMDLGLIFEQSGSNSNLGFFYDASASKFVLQQGLAEDGTTTGSISLNSYAPLHVAAFNATSGDFSGDMTAATITMTGFTVDADGDTALKSLTVDDGSTIGCDSDTDLLTLASAALTAKGTVTVGVDDTGHDVKFFGATSGKSLLWDESEDSLVITGDATDALRVAGGVDIDGVINVGLDDTGYDVKFFGDTASAYMLWDASADDLILGGAAGLIVPEGQLTLGSTAVTSTAAELNVLDGYADAAFSNTADSIVFADADASTGGSDLRRESTSDFLTAIAGDGLSVAASQLKTNVPAEEFFQSASTTFALSVAPSAMVDNSLAVYLNGMLQLASGSIVSQSGDYYTTGSNLVMTDALDEDDVLIVRYVAK